MGISNKKGIVKKEQDEILGRVDKGRLRGHTNGVGSFLNFWAADIVGQLLSIANKYD